MAPSPTFSWPTLTTYESAATWPPLAPLARAYYAAQGRLVRAADYLALPATAASEPFIGNTAARELVAASLPTTGPSDETYAQYVARTAASAHPLLNVLMQTLQERGITLAAFTQALADQGEASYLPALLDAGFWAAVVAAWQRQVQHQLDVNGRSERLLATQQALPAATMLVRCYNRVLATLPGASLESVQALPLNELASALWLPQLANDDAVLTQLAGLLQPAAQQVVVANYPDEELTDRLLARLDPALPELAQPLLLSKDGQAAVVTIFELAQASPEEVTSRLAALPANHPFVYALASWFQDKVRRFLQNEAPAPLLIPQALAVQAQLLGASATALAGFGLRLSRVLASQEGSEHPLGTLLTGADGRFVLSIPRDLYLTDEDTLAEAPTSVRAAVYYPGQDPATEPALTLLLEPSGDGAELTLTTDLPANAPAPASATLASLADSLPAALSELLVANSITSLADLRAANGLQGLELDLLAVDPATAYAAQRLDGLAQLEVMGADMTLNEQVVAAGFYSPTQVARSVSQSEFVNLLVGTDALDEQRVQAATFYNKAVTVSTLSQTLGLLTRSQRTSTGTPALTLADLMGSDGGTINEDPAPAPAEFLTAFTSEAQFSQTESVSVSKAAPDGGAITYSLVGGLGDPALTGGATPVPGHPLQAGLNPAPAGFAFNYSAEQQCDCPACRSAVSPTAYLAALLNYAAGSEGNNRIGKLFKGSDRVTPSQLQALLREPYCDLPVSCQSANELVCQYRLAIEVVQAHWRASGTAALTVGQARAYVEAAADALLQALGTTLAEVRALTGPALTELATRLQLTDELLTYMQTRLSASYLVDSQDLDGVEADLEELFGLGSTARDPLSTGLLLDAATANAGPVQLVRQRFEGLTWGLNTGPDGRLHLEVIPPSGSFPGRVTVYATDSTGQQYEDNVVARGTLVPPATLSPMAPNSYTGMLYPQHGSGLKGSVVVKLTGTALTTTNFTVVVVPRVTAVRQQTLRAEWLAQDDTAIAPLRAHDQASWSGFTFLVDPDLLGPDDFRRLTRTAPDYGNRALVLWQRRYNFLQHQLVPALLGLPSVPASTPLGSVIDALTQQTIAYASDGGTTYLLTPWPASLAAPSGTSLLAQLHTQLAGDAVAVSAATVLLNSLGLNAEAMQRLYDLWQQDSTQPLAPADYQEALDIIRQSVKKGFESSWAREEGDLQLTAKEFQLALHEPLVGVWEQARADAFGLAACKLPQIDPDEVTPLELPDAGFGDTAAQLWSQRQAELLRKRQALVALGQATLTALVSGVPAARQQADAMLRYAYRPDPSGTPVGGTPAFASFEAAWAAFLNEADTTQHAAADTYITRTLALRPVEAERLASLRAQVLSQPTDGPWQEMAALLTLGWKRAVAYRQSYVPEGTAPYIGAGATPGGTPVVSWLAQETAALPALTTLDYLLATRKHRLVKWRASAAARAQWAAALALATQRPLLDPDQLVPGDFRQAGERSRNNYVGLADADKPYLNPAYELYAQRVSFVQSEVADNLSALQNASAADRWDLVAAKFFSTRAELEGLHTQQQAGVDVSAGMRRLNLSSAALDFLLGQLNPTAAGNERLPELAHLLTQQTCYRTYATWAREEVNLGLIPGPEFFLEPQPEAVSLATQPWRSSATARRQWQRRLAARYAQAEALADAQPQAVRAVEDQYLPLLRDALILAKNPEVDGTLTAKAEYLEAKYLLDFQAVCCQQTTRVAQATAVLQQVFFNQRNSLSADQTGLTMATDEEAARDFDNEWQWLSSYERWRSLMFLFLYPENVLLPTLKLQPTQQFKDIAQQVRQSAQLTPASAQVALNEYQKYIDDYNSLQLKASCQTDVDLPLNGGEYQTHAVNFQVALAPRGKAYWHLACLDSIMLSAPGQSWDAIPSSLSLGRLVDCCVFQTVAGGRYLCVFAFVRTGKVLSSGKIEQQFAVQRLNLSSWTWDTDFAILDLGTSEPVDSADCILLARRREDWAPTFSILASTREMMVSDLEKLNFSMPANFSSTVTGDRQLRFYTQHAMKQAELLQVRLSDDCTAMAVIASNPVLGFNSVQLWAGLQKNVDVFYQLLLQHNGPDSSTSHLSNLCVYSADELLRQTSTHFDFFDSPTRTKLVIDNQFSYGLVASPIVPDASQINPNYLDVVKSIQLAFGRMADYTASTGYGRAYLTSDFQTSNPYITGSVATSAAMQVPSNARYVGFRQAATAPYTYEGIGYAEQLELYYETGMTYNAHGTLQKISFHLGGGQMETFAETLSHNFRLAYWGADPNATTNGQLVPTPLSTYSSFIGPAVISLCNRARPTGAGAAAYLASGFYSYNIAPVLVEQQLSATGASNTIVGRMLVQLPMPLTAHTALRDIPLLGLFTRTKDLAVRRTTLTAKLAALTSTDNVAGNVVWEAYYYVPLLLANALSKGKYYETALQYFRLFFDYTRPSPAVGSSPPDEQLNFPGLAAASHLSTSAQFAAIGTWLANPDNPHALAGLRPDAHRRYVTMAAVRCLLAYADDEFGRDNVESVARARSLYELSRNLLRQNILPYDVQDSAALLNQLDSLVAPTWAAEWLALKQVLAAINQRSVLLYVLQTQFVNGNVRPGLAQLFRAAQTGTTDWTTTFEAAWLLVGGQLLALTGQYETLCNSPALATTTVPAVGGILGALLAFYNSTLVATTSATSRPVVPFLDGRFCVPTNPVPYALLLQAELNLYKIRSCRNIAGIQRELDAYAAATDNTTGLPTIGTNGQLAATGRLVVPATPFRYSYLLERARQLVGLAQQTESSLLSALEKRDAEAYNLLKARQDIAVSRATVQLQDLRITEASDGVDLSSLQLERSEIMEQQYDDWLSEGLNGFEQDMLEAIQLASSYSQTQSILGGVASGASAFAGAEGLQGYVFASISAAASVAAGIYGAYATEANTRAQLDQNRASFQRRADEWKFQRNLAAQDIKIGQQQIKLSDDRLRIAGQEKLISQLQLDHAESVLNFLTTKFTNAELYDWMSSILETAYSYFLQQATATARLAEQQLAFERQEVPAGIVQDDYWTPPADSTDPTAGSAGTSDRKGLTGSVRLLQDLTRLDEYAFETTRRKLQLTKTISLAQNFPTEFVRFRDTGVLAFACQPEWFDQDFPGHYLRVLRRVRTSVIALVPPVDGIKARLSTAGTSHVTVNGAPFQTLALPRVPEEVALTAPLNATGLFELDQQSSELLLPFEGLGVDVPWQFSMQPASNPNLDYAAVADVLVTLDYSALSSADYARQVVQQLGTERQQQVVLSLRDRFADQWYDLHHADEVAPADRYVARLTLTANDLPLHLRNASISQVSLFVDAPLDEDTTAAGAFIDRSHLELRLTRGAGVGGAAFTNQYGLISTRTGAGAGPLYTGNAASLVPLIGSSPAGEWALSIAPGRLRDRLAAGLVTDIYLIVEVEGNAPTYVV